MALQSKLSVVGSEKKKRTEEEEEEEEDSFTVEDNLTLSSYLFDT